MKTLFLLLILISTAFAQDPKHEESTLPPIRLMEEVKVKSGDTAILSLPRYTFIDRITLEIKTSLLCGDDSVRFSFDGHQSQSVMVNNGLKGWRTKIITVMANARNIELYNTSNCTIRVKNIIVLPRRININQGYPVPKSEAASYVSFLMETMLYLDSLVADADRVAYITPSKKVFGRALAVLNNAPETGAASLNAIKDVLEFLNSAAPFIERLQTIENTFEIAQEIQSSKVALERMIR